MTHRSPSILSSTIIFDFVCIWILFCLYVHLAALGCGNENGRCEDMCINTEGFISCSCSNVNETLAPQDNRICVCKLTIFSSTNFFHLKCVHCSVQLNYSTSHCMMKCMKMQVPLYIILYTILISFNWAVTVKLFLIVLEGGFSQQMIIV